MEITIGSAEGDAAEAAGLVRIHSRDGSVWEGSVSGSRGTASHPISDDSILAKFRANCGDSTLASELSDLMLNLSQQPNLDRIHDLAATIVTQEAQPR